jgi:hypothetical protein
LGGFLEHAATRRKHAETAIEAGIAAIAGSKVTNQWGSKAFFIAAEVTRYLIT